MPKFTEQQQAAIFSRGEELLVSAAAGSGKTAVLVERIASLIADGEDPASFLAVTFTKAAAAELKERLTRRIEELGGAEAELEARLERLSLATISTIDSFCKLTLDRYFEQAGLEADFRVLDEDESAELFENALDNALDAAFEDEAFAGRLEPLGSMAKLRAEAASLHSFLMSQPGPEEWLAGALARYEAWAAEPERSPWAQELRTQALLALRGAAQKARQALEMAQVYASPYLPAIQGDLDLLRALERGEAQGVAFSRLPAIKKGEKTGEDLAIQDLRGEYKKAAQAAALDLMPPDGIERFKLVETIQPLRALGELSLRLDREFTRLKRESNGVDFADLERLTLALLQDERVLGELRARYAQVFIDEYQDSSAVQEAILKAVSRGNNRFLVGDAKQSIYRFRQAEPGIFLRHSEAFSQGKGGRLIALNRNFRSNAGILAAVNRVFSLSMRKESAEIDYDADAALYPGRAWARNSATLVSLVSPPGERAEIRDFPAEEHESTAENAEGGGKEEKRAAVLEARRVARLALEMHGSLIEEDGVTRPADWRDIVILLRSPRNLVRYYAEELAALGIPAYAEAGGGVYESLEMAGALDYLAALDNPRKELPLLGALRGVGGFLAEELAKIRLKGANLPFYGCLKLYARNGEDAALREKAKGFVDRLWALRRFARENPVSLTVEAALEENGYIERCLALPGGRTREANLRALVLRARRFDGPQHALADFLRFARGLRERGREGDTPTLSQKDDVLRLMSVHKAKGLEFPIVIGAGLGRGFNLRGSAAQAGLLADRGLGLAIGFLDPKLQIQAGTFAQRALAARKKRQLWAEEMRLLYVLMTRPKDRLVLSACVKDLPARCAEWAQGPAAAPRSMMDFIGPALLRHPDAAALRHLANLGSAAQGDESAWDIRLEESQADEDAERHELEQILALLEGMPLPNTPQNPFETPSFTPNGPGARKESVTELARQGERDAEYIHERPRFLRRGGAGMDAAEKGSAVHAAMRLFNLSALKGLTGEALRANIQAQLNGLASRQAIDLAQLAAVDATRLCAFFEGELGRAVLKARAVYREQPFVLRLEEGRLAQGVIDLFFEDEEGVVLIDYKTDRRNLDEESVRGRHGPQLSLYAKALREAGLRLKRCCVYLFETGRAVEIALPPD
ncbi:MAG: UvrD-helicase domain-containing protein [Christensenellaceae bacterium]|jgi:ATP-dependent helicase/nuclease subunit A|nr:UvrD-helicase domain-containing protein [Christensenellaceae bacterium]